ncbi:HlyD family secretion protein [Pseudoxanthomonas indica]|nr:HlyD family efflux transporter periplasmic adaptor subunit [Pseudoxanthomonas indica]GGD51858.1 secretion protein [Pseudoxanthomonas indica]
MVLLYFGEYSYHSRVRGQLVPDLGVSSLFAPAAGVVARLYVPEGRVVEAGEPLVRIEVPNALSDGQGVEKASRQALDAQAASVRMADAASAVQWSLDRESLTEQLQQVELELRQTEQSIATRQQQVVLARATLDRFLGISDTQVVSKIQVDQQEQAWLEWVNQLQTMERQATNLSRTILQMRKDLHKLPAKRQAQSAATINSLAQLQHQRIVEQASSEVLLKAPVDGLLATHLVESGQNVLAGQHLVSLVPKGSNLQAHLWIPSRAIGFVQPGDTVLLRYAAYPYQKFGHARGRVARISRIAVKPHELESSGAYGSLSEPYYRAVVLLESQSMLAYGNEEPLRPGMALEADIMGERRKLYEWLLEPLYALSGSLN